MTTSGWTIPLITCLIAVYPIKGILQCCNLVTHNSKMSTSTLYLNAVSVLPLSVSSSLLALLVNLDRSFAYSYVLPVLWKVRRPANTFPTHSLCGVCLTRTHQYASTSLSLSLSVVSPPLSPGHPSGGSSVFVQQQCASGLCCVKVLPTVSSLSRPLAVYSLCPPPVSLFLSQSFCFLILSVVLPSSIISCPPLYFAFSRPVLPFIPLIFSTYLCLTGPLPEKEDVQLEHKRIVV